MKTTIILYILKIIFVLLSSSSSSSSNSNETHTCFKPNHTRKNAQTHWSFHVRTDPDVFLFLFIYINKFHIKSQRYFCNNKLLDILWICWAVLLMVVWSGWGPGLDVGGSGAEAEAEGCGGSSSSSQISSNFRFTHFPTSSIHSWRSGSTH